MSCYLNYMKQNNYFNKMKKIWNQNYKKIIYKKHKIQVFLIFIRKKYRICKVKYNNGKLIIKKYKINNLYHLKKIQKQIKLKY